MLTTSLEIARRLNARLSQPDGVRGSYRAEDGIPRTGSKSKSNHPLPSELDKDEAKTHGHRGLLPILIIRGGVIACVDCDGAIDANMSFAKLNLGTS